MAGILTLDVVLVASIFHTAALLGPFAPLGIVSYAVFLGLGHSYFKKHKEDLPFGARFFVAHIACIAIIWSINFAALHGFSFLLNSEGAHIVSRVLLLAAISLTALACIPAQVWVRTIRETKWLWLYSILTGTLAWCLRFPFQSFWDSSSTAPGRFLQRMTFHSVKVLLRVFLPDIYVDSETFIIGTPRFSIFVAEACSGLEGIGLVLAFTVIWLWYFRRESRFPQALLLVPCALLSVWMLNVLRISALVLIGNAGYGEVAMVGFHSQAGWIAFTVVAFAFSMATRKLPWVRRRYYFLPSTADHAHTTPIFLDDEDTQVGESPLTGAYLVPFLAILAASFVSKAASGYFEWLYPLRFLAASIAIWYYWPELKQINWRFSWWAPITGTAVFALWLVPSFLTHSNERSQLGAALAALSPVARLSWIAFRVAAAVITVPIAEELAFRGYLARRLVNREFDIVPFSAVTILSIGLSSVLFGLMHGHQWIVGILAGLVYAGLMKWKGRLGDAVIAHATSNLLLAIWVLSRGDWSQW
ncbi:exosortase E/protease, VPEID-CTERM system [Acidicapsa acidisoli]|uniref:exosortase E/protease, VPEID-CTERM system n=1 Tax=Acidicapsa acidisoli TaxID=1615681 RepID=UPI0021E05717|nr:exosortase E/protease, VPEID-CTERM system [Acidicapsa acidisoli]